MKERDHAAYDKGRTARRECEPYANPYSYMYQRNSFRSYKLGWQGKAS